MRKKLRDSGVFWTTTQNNPPSFSLNCFCSQVKARMNELLKEIREKFDLEKGLWIKPSSLTEKKKREHLPLSSEAIEILQELKNLN
jgi:integrase